MSEVILSSIKIPPNRKGKKFVIIVGPDGAGKTTLVESLKKEYIEAIFFKGVKIPGPINAVNATKEYLLKAQQSAMDYICDRFMWPDAPIYDLVVEGIPWSTYGSWFQDVQTHYLAPLNPLLIYVRCNADEILRRWEVIGKDPYLQPHQVARLVEVYDSVLMSAKCARIYIESDKLDAQEVFETAVKAIGEHYSHVTAK